MSYDFKQAFTEGFSNGMGTIATQRMNICLLHGLFGPKVHTSGPNQAFATVKGGFTNFRLDPRPAAIFGTFASSVRTLRANTMSGVLYPGAGLEGHIGPVGLLLDVEDEIYFNGGSASRYPRDIWSSHSLLTVASARAPFRKGAARIVQTLARPARIRIAHHLDRTEQNLAPLVMLVSKGGRLRPIRPASAPNQQLSHFAQAVLAWWLLRSRWTQLSSLPTS